jgi:hypothetical protein
MMPNRGPDAHKFGHQVSPVSKFKLPSVPNPSFMFLLAAATNPQDFFTWGSFTTLAGATGIVYIVCGVIQNVFNFSPKWFALAFSIVVSLTGVLISQHTGSGPSDNLPPGVQYVIAILNGFLIYSSAAGCNQLISHDRGKEDRQPAGNSPTKKSATKTFGPAPIEPVPQTKRSFSDNWWR